MKTARVLAGQNLKLLRDCLNLSAAEISKVVGVSSVQVYRIEKGDTPLSLDHIDKICTKYGIDPAYFLIDQDAPRRVPEKIIPKELHRVKDLPNQMRNNVEHYISFLLYLLEQKAEAAKLTDDRGTLIAAVKKRSRRRSSAKIT